MLEPRRRRFTLADAMLLVAATTPGMILLRIAVGFNLFARDPSPRVPPGRDFVEFLSLAVACVLLSLSPAVLVLTARLPEPTRRDVIGGPGFVACLAAMVALVFPLAYFAVGVAFSHGIVNNITLYYNNMVGRWVHVAGPMITGAWLALALVGRWQVKPIWTDRLGCVIGACCVLLYVYVEFYFIVVLPLLRWWAS
jgi:hypothetical protein